LAGKSGVRRCRPRGFPRWRSSLGNPTRSHLERARVGRQTRAEACVPGDHSYMGVGQNVIGALLDHSDSAYTSDAFTSYRARRRPWSRSDGYGCVEVKAQVGRWPSGSSGVSRRLIRPQKWELCSSAAARAAGGRHSAVTSLVSMRNIKRYANRKLYDLQ
jgi:hypothetical protein